MSEIGLHRGLAGLGVGLNVGLGVRGEHDQRTAR